MKPLVLAIDDNQDKLDAVAQAVADDFNLITATSPHEGMQLLIQHKHELHSIIIDNHMEGEFWATKLVHFAIDKGMPSKRLMVFSYGGRPNDLPKNIAYVYFDWQAVTKLGEWLREVTD